MASKKILLNDFETESQPHLMGIHTSLKGYELAFHLNRMARASFRRASKDIGMPFENGFLARYEWIQNKLENVCDLFANKLYIASTPETDGLFTDTTTLKQVYLLREFNQIDFFIRTKHNSILRSLKKTLQQLPQVYMSYTIPQEQVKTPLNLIFD